MLAGLMGLVDGSPSLAFSSVAGLCVLLIWYGTR